VNGVTHGLLTPKAITSNCGNRKKEPVNRKKDCWIDPVVRQRRRSIPTSAFISNHLCGN
jgi:hypothetical protein